jgi:tetratricopeptide (TPR) repeat protein
MSRTFLFFIGSILLSSGLYSQPEQDIVRFEDLYFYSYFEEAAFYNFSRDSKDMLMLFAAIDPDVNEKIFTEFKKDLQQELARLRSRKFLRAKPEKQVGLIYNYVNTQVLTRYQEKILFPHLFVNGTFNCLTASAYYGFLLDTLGIPYYFMETYDHVHPVAFPGQKQIKIETTDRITGIQYYDDKLKEKFVNYLLQAGRITREEYYAKSTEDLFNEYFLPQTNIGLTELAGLHYMNDALYRFDAGHYQEAFQQIKKAYYIYPSERMLTLFQFILANTLGETEFTNEAYAQLLVYVSRLPEERINTDEIGLSFAILTERVLFNSSLMDYYDTFFTYLDEHMQEGKVKDIISFYYYFLRGKSFLAQYMFRDGLEFFIKAYNYNPENLELQSLLISSLAATFENTPGQKLIDQLENYAEELPLIAQNGMFISMQMTAYLVVVEQCFDFEDPEKGLIYLKKFEKLYTNNKGVEIDHQQVGDAYSAAAVYYFKKNQMAKARQYLNRGLEISPDNYELLYRLRSIN